MTKARASLKVLLILAILGGAAVTWGAVGARYLRIPGSDRSSVVPDADSGPGPGDWRGRSPVAVGALGRLTPEGDVVHVGAPPGDRLERIEVVEGQSVREGEPLAYLESYSERLAEKAYIAAQLEEARTRLATETDYGRALIDEAKIALIEIQEVPPRDVRAQEAQVKIEEARLDSAKSDLARAQRLKLRSAIPDEDLEHQTLAEIRAQQELDRARALLEKLKIGHEIDINEAKARLATAEAQLERSLSAILVRSLEKNLELAEARLRRTTIRAPHKGRILKVFLRAGEEVGTGPILDLGDTDQMYVVAEVYETDVGRVRLGQRATVTSPAFDRPLSGNRLPGRADGLQERRPERRPGGRRRLARRRGPGPSRPQ
jgi:HlyD family secretion protein